MLKDILTNAEIADRLSTLAQLLSMEKANPYKIKAYRRAANTIRGLREAWTSLYEVVRTLLCTLALERLSAVR